MNRLLHGLLLAGVLAGLAHAHAADEKISDLVKKCADPEPAVRLAAINEIGNLEQKSMDANAADIAAALLAEIRDKDEKAHEAGVALLNAQAARGGIFFETLISFLQDIHVAPAANLFMMAFDKIPLKEIPFLLKSLAAEHWAVRQAAARALGRLHPAGEETVDTKLIVPALIDALKDENRLVRVAVSEALQVYATDAVPALLKALNEGAPELRAGAAFGAGYLHAACPPKEMVAALHALLKDPKLDTRMAAIASLGEYGIEARNSLPDLEAALQDDSAELRIVAALSIEKISSALHDATLPVLLQALANGAPAHRLDIVTALERWNLELAGPLITNAAPPLIAVLDDASSEVRRRAMQALVKVARGNKEALWPLVEALKSPQPLVRLGATTVFVQLGVEAKDAAPKLVEAMQHDDLLIREVAAQVLLRVAPKAPEATVATRLINEATIFRTCKTYVAAQSRYQQRADGDGDFAQTLKGNHSLLETKSGAADLKFISKTIADAEGEPGKGAAVYAAYRFKILKAQGAGAPGGAKSYVVKGRMTAGHALIAYPAKYDAGGRLTFMVSDEGTVYFKDLGADTAALVTKIAEFNPDESWKSAKEAEAEIEPMKF